MVSAPLYIAESQHCPSLADVADATFEAPVAKADKAGKADKAEAAFVENSV